MLNAWTPSDGQQREMDLQVGGQASCWRWAEVALRHEYECKVIGVERKVSAAWVDVRVRLVDGYWSWVGNKSYKQTCFLILIIILIGAG